MARFLWQCLLQLILELKHHCTPPSPSMKQCYRCSSYSPKELLLQRTHCTRHCFFLRKLDSDLPESLTRDITTNTYGIDHIPCTLDSYGTGLLDACLVTTN